MAGVTRNLIVALTSQAGAAFSKGFNQARSEIGSFEVAVRKTSQGSMSNFSKRTDAMAAGLRNVAVAVGGALVVRELGRAVVDAVDSFAQFDDKLTQSTAIMGDLSETMQDELAAAAREVGRETRFAADEAAEAFYFLASAGLDAEQSIAALPEVAQFAQAGMFDLALATDLLTDAQSALGLTVDDAEENLINLSRVSDVLVKGNTLANASVQQFSEALTNRAAAAARLVGIEVEEVVAVLAAFADQGVKGERAGEAFSIVLRDLQRAALDNEDAFREFNIQVFDTAGEIRPIADIIGDLEGALTGLSDQQVRTTLTTLGFQERSISNLLTLVGTSEAIRDYESALQDAGGTTEAVADKQLQSLSGQLELVQSAFEDTKISIGEALAPAIKEQIPGLIDAIDLLGDSIAGAFEEWGPGAIEAVGTIISQVSRIPSALAEVNARVQSFSADFYKGLLQGLGPLGELLFAVFGDSADDFINDLEVARGAADQTARVYDVLGKSLAGALDPGQTRVTALANGLLTLRNEGRLTAEAWDTLTGSFGLDSSELEEVIRLLEGEGVSSDRSFIREELEAINKEARDEAASDRLTGLAESMGLVGDSAGDAAGGVDEFGNALDDVDAEKAEEEFEKLRESVAKTIDAFAEAPDEIEVSVQELIDRASARIEQSRRFQTALETLARAGLDSVVRELRDAGPAAASTAEELAGDIAAAFDLEQQLEEELDLALLALDVSGNPALARAIELWAQYGIDFARAMNIGFSDTVSFQVPTPDGGTRTVTGRRLGGVGAGSTYERRADGGPVTAGQQYVVGEEGPETYVSGSPEIVGADGPEMFTPKMSGFIYPERLEFRATGGPVSAGDSYIVGEQGPELFVPRTNGTIVPNTQSVSNSVTVQISNPQVRDLDQDLQRGLLIGGIANRVEVSRI